MLFICGLTRKSQWPQEKMQHYYCLVMHVRVLTIPAAVINIPLIFFQRLTGRFFVAFFFFPWCNSIEDVFVTYTSGEKYPHLWIFTILSVGLSNNSLPFEWSCHLTLSLSKNTSLLLCHWNLMFFKRCFHSVKIGIKKKKWNYFPSSDITIVRTKRKISDFFNLIIWLF